MKKMKLCVLLCFLLAGLLGTTELNAQQGQKEINLNNKDHKTLLTESAHSENFLPPRQLKAKELYEQAFGSPISTKAFNTLLESSEENLNKWIMVLDHHSKSLSANELKYIRIIRDGMQKKLQAQNTNK